jgi:hypothetical protein
MLQKMTFILSMIFAISAFAAPTSGDEDVNKVASAFKKYLLVLNEPVLVFHYFDGSHAGPKWNQALSASDPMAYKYVKESSEIYWRYSNQESPGNMYGRGLYVAGDPVSTLNYGGDNFVLLQIQLPQGFRVLELVNGNNIPFSAETQKILSRHGCPEGTNIMSLMMPQVFKSPECHQIVQQVLREKLQIDAFRFEYPRADFNECTATSREGYAESNSALLITNGTKFKPEMIRAYNKFSTDDKENRVNIESLFYKTSYEATKNPHEMASWAQTNYMQKIVSQKDPGYDITVVSPECDSKDRCSIVYEICKNKDDSDCKKIPQIPVPVQSYPKFFDMMDRPIILFDDSASNGPWGWLDLNHQPTARDPGAWLKNNLMGCSQKNYFIPAYPKGSR